MPISDAEFNKLRKDVDGLLTTRIWVLAICGVLAALGINGQFVLNDVKDRVTKVNASVDEAQKRVGELQETVKNLPQNLDNAVKSLVDKAEAELKRQVQAGIGELNETARNLKATLPAAVSLLDTEHQYVFVNQGTGESHLVEIQDMPASGAVVDCSDKVPSEAKGVIIAALVANPIGRSNAIFVCSDGNGSFNEPRNGQILNGIYNYSNALIGGILFCSFLNGTKQFKYLLGADKGTPDTTVRCRAAVIGWF